MSVTPPLVPLPSGGGDAAWPGSGWDTGPLVHGDTGRVAEVVGRAFDHNPNPATALSLALVVVQAGRIVLERYGPDTGPATPLLSWSVAKSVTHAALGAWSVEHPLDLDAPCPAPEWPEGDPRAAITLRHLLEMRPGLEFNEDYVDATTSHCLEMLFGEGADDVAGYTARQRLVHPPGTVFNYASGTTTLLARHLGDLVVGGHLTDPTDRRAALEAFLHSSLFARLGMSSAEPRFDAAGTWVGSSYLYATARDFARFGLLYLRDGVWDGVRVLPAGWVDQARTAVSHDEEDDIGYGHHWWVAGPLDRPDLGTFWANGYEGQRILVLPALDTVIVRLGRTPAAHRPDLLAFYRDLLDALAD